MRIVLAGVALVALAACDGRSEFDWDLRSNGGTAEAARQATENRPSADSRGVITYPDYQVVVARRDDTVAGVAARLGLSPDELARANALQANDPLRQGEVLLLPRKIGGETALAAAPGTGAVIGGSGAGVAPVDVTAIATTALDRVGTPPAAAAPAPVSGREPMRHRVARGETAFTIARSYNVSAKALADWNGLGPDMAVREGQTLIIPVASGPAPVAEPVATPPGAGTPTPEPPSAKKPLPDEATAPVAAPTAKPKDAPASPDLGAERTAASSSKMAMPVQGSIIRGYVKKKNDGIDISAPAGTAVKAAAAGTVAAITKDTDQVPIVVIRHADNLLTVYAGVDALKVKKGDTVTRGQQIAAVRAGNPAFVHFEVRRGVDSLDPAGFLQ